MQSLFFRKTVWLLLCIFVPSLLVAQKSVISGSVTDITGQGMPGVSIVESGTTNGTISDFDGNFSISVSASGKLIFLLLVTIPKKFRLMEVRAV